MTIGKSGNLRGNSFDNRSSGLRNARKKMRECLGSNEIDLLVEADYYTHGFQVVETEQADMDDRVFDIFLAVDARLSYD